MQVAEHWRTRSTGYVHTGRYWSVNQLPIGCCAIRRMRCCARVSRCEAKPLPGCAQRDLGIGHDGAGRCCWSCPHHPRSLGIVDHGSRRSLFLRAIASKFSWQLLSWLCQTIDQFGKPRAIRTDNERCFTSSLFALGLKLLGMLDPRIDKGCPWQNGRIERFFGTLKQNLKQVQFD